MEETSNRQTMLDQLVTDDRSQMLKAAVPYLPPGGRRLFAVYAKFLELAHTMQLFGSQTESSFPASLSAASMSQTRLSQTDDPNLLHAASADQTEPLEMLRDIRRYCSGSAGERLDALMNMMAMLEMIQIMNEPEEE